MWEKCSTFNDKCSRKLNHTLWLPVYPSFNSIASAKPVKCHKSFCGELRDAFVNVVWKMVNKIALNHTRYKQSFYDPFHVTSRWVLKFLHPRAVRYFCPHFKASSNCFVKKNQFNLNFRVVSFEKDIIFQSHSILQSHCNRHLFPRTLPNQRRLSPTHLLSKLLVHAINSPRDAEKDELRRLHFLWCFKDCFSCHPNQTADLPAFDVLFKLHS